MELKARSCLEGLVVRIKAVAEDRMTKAQHVHAELMRAPGPWP